MIYPNPFVPVYNLSIHSVLWQEASQLAQLLREDFPIDRFNCLPCEILLCAVESCHQSDDWQWLLLLICDGEI